MFEPISSDYDVNSKFNAFKSDVDRLSEKFIPKSSASTSTKTQPLWMNSEVKLAVVKKHKAWNIHQKQRSIQSRITFNQVRNETTRTINQANKKLRPN